MSQPPQDNAGSAVAGQPINTQPPQPIFYESLPSEKPKKGFLEKNLANLIAIAVGVVNLAFGIRYKNECPVEPMIPIFCIVYGSFSIAVCLIGIARQGYTNNDDAEEKSAHPLEYLIYLFLFVWFIVGCVYIYRVKAKVNTDDSEDPNYCNGTLYWDAYWFANVMNGLFALMIVFVCFALIQDCCGKGKKGENVQPSV